MKHTSLHYMVGRAWQLLLISVLAVTFTPTETGVAAQLEADAITPEEAWRAAQAWVETCPHFVRARAATAYAPAPEMLALRDRAGVQTVAYVLHLRPEGYVIVSPSRDLIPIIAYSVDSRFDATEGPGNVLLDLLRGDIPDRLEAVQAGLIDASERDKAHILWDSYLEMVDSQGQIQDGSVPAWAVYDVEYGPYVSSTWGQSTDGGGQVTFNYYTPNAYVCGCVATALGQILNYYKWPVMGTGSHSYTWDNGTDPVQELSADFGSTTYAWANILDDYSDSAKADLYREAAGKLAYHAGVAVDMNYDDTSRGGSGAYTSDVAEALKEYFRASGEYVSNGGTFYDRLYANMVNGRPAELSIRNSVTLAGHAVVVDGVGYNAAAPETKYYHLNMGWSGTDDAWYNLPSVTTPSPNSDFDTVNGAVLDIVPEPNMAEVSGTVADACFPMSWDVATHQGASRYELQQAQLGTTPGSVFDGAETGAGSWLIDGNWEASSSKKVTGSYSFRGFFNESVKYSTMLLDKALKIGPSTSITYWWGINYHINGRTRLQISTDGRNWTTLKTYDQEDESGSILWTQETSVDLSPYAGQVAFLRFALDHVGGSYYNGDTYAFVGFFVDDFSIANVYTGEWTTVDNTLTTESREVTVSTNGDYAYRARPETCDPSQASCTATWWSWSDVETVTVSGLCGSAGTGNWSAGSTWSQGTAPESSNSAVINSGHIVTVDGSAACHDLVIQGGGAAVVASGTTLHLGDDLVVYGTLTNNGTLQQTRAVSGSSDVTFLDDPSYGGVVLNANGADLGQTTINVRGHQNCTSDPAGSLVRRCLDIYPEVGAGLNATLRFYFSAAELNGVTCSDVELWHWNGSAYSLAGTLSARQCSAEPYYVEYSGVTELSPFVGDDDTPPEYPPTEPTAVDLAGFQARAEGEAIFLTWETVSEVDTLGFHLYRATSAVGQRTRLNEALIPGQMPGSPVGMEYSWLDQAVLPGVTYFYWLEEVNTFGQLMQLGPVSAAVPRQSIWQLPLRRSLTVPQR